jgi:hypothetical protein
LTTLAIVECREDVEVFSQRLRTMMKRKPSASVAPKLLTRTMTMSHFQEALAYYQRLKAQLDRSNVSPEDHGDVSTAPTSPAAESAHPPVEDVPAVPFAVASSSASVPAEAGPGQPAQPAAIYATPQEIAALKRLAAQVSPEAAEDLQDVLDHAPKGLMPDLYRRIEARLQARLNSTKTAAVA